MRHYSRLLSLFLVLILLSFFRGAPALAQEAEASVSGTFTVIWGDPAPESAVDVPLPVYTITGNNGQSTRLAITETTLRAVGGIMAINWKQITATGRFAVPVESTASPNGRQTLFEVESLHLPAQIPDNQALPGATAFGAAVNGSQPWISILCKFADVSDEPESLTYFQDMYASTYPGLDHYWREVSYNTVNVVGSGAVGWYTLPKPRSYYVYDIDGDDSLDLNHERASNDCTAVADNDVYFPDYVGINLMFNDDLDGFAWGGGDYLTLDGASRIWRVTWEPPWGYGHIGVIYHEMGHGFGLPHSSGDYGKTYDNVWDVMSAHWPYCHLTDDPVYGCLGQHTISYHKDKLGWIPAALKHRASPNQQDTITLERLALPQTGNYLMIEIPIGGSTTHFYTVEVRHLAGYDQMLPGEAVIIHEVDTTRSRPAHVIDIDGKV